MEGGGPRGPAASTGPTIVRFASILVLTYGRTGSTLLTGVLNAMPGVLVRGENQNMFAGLYHGYRRLRSTRELYADNAHCSTSPFFGTHRLCERRYLDHARALARDQLVAGSPREVSVYGFKETRYTRAQLAEDGVGPLPPYLDFLAALFPSPAFVVLTRAHGDAAASSFWRRLGEGEARRQMTGFDEDVGGWARGRDDVLPLDYDAALAGPRPFGALFDFLGAAYDAPAVGRVLGIRHSDDISRPAVMALPWPGDAAAA